MARKTKRKSYDAKDKTNLAFSPAIRDMVDEQVIVYGTVRKVVNAACWLFAQATPEIQKIAIRAASGLIGEASPQQANPTELAQDIRRLLEAVDAESERSTRKSNRSKGKAG